MKLDAYKPLHRDGVPLEEPAEGDNPIGDIPEWHDQMLEPTHKQIMNLTRMAQGLITFGENINAEIRRLSMFHNVPIEVTLSSMKGNPLGIIPVYWDVEQFASFRPKIIDLKTVRLTVNFDSDPGRAVDVIVIILGS